MIKLAILIIVTAGTLCSRSHSCTDRKLCKRRLSWTWFRGSHSPSLDSRNIHRKWETKVIYFRCVFFPSSFVINHKIFRFPFCHSDIVQPHCFNWGCGNLFEHYVCGSCRRTFEEKAIFFFRLQLLYFLFLSAVSTTNGHTEVVNKLDKCVASAWIFFVIGIAEKAFTQILSQINQNPAKWWSHFGSVQARFLEKITSTLDKEFSKLKTRRC